MLPLKQKGAISLREATKKEISENNRSEKKEKYIGLICNKLTTFTA